MINKLKRYWEQFTNPPVNGPEIRGFWQSAFNAGWRKNEILALVRRRFGVHPSELRRKQVRDVLEVISTMEGHHL